MSSDALGKLYGKRLVIFGAGYVGSALARRAMAAGAEVIALTRNEETAKRLSAEGAAVVQADLDSDVWHPRIGNVDMLVNCVSSAGGGSVGYIKSYVEGARSILRWLERVDRPESLIYTSSTSVYPQASGVVDETSPTAEATGNARVLLQAEELILGAAMAGLCGHSTVLRLSGIYGPGRHHVLDQLKAGGQPIPGRGEHLLNLIYRDDIVSAICTVLTSAPKRTEHRVFNVTDDCPVKKETLVRWLVERLGLEFPGFSGEAVPGRRAGVLDRSVSNRRISEELGWRPQYPDFRAGYAAILGA